MSEPVKKDEVEDVLSSIRRLVATDRPAPAVEAPTKLVLTNAQRVDSDTDAWSNSLELRIAELEAAVIAQKNDFEPDGSETGDGETPRGINHFAAAQATALAEGETDEVAARVKAFLDENPTVEATQAEPAAAEMDEAELSALIRQIVRAELQGEIGERITRSVRKLVRREIQSALTARGYD